MNRLTALLLALLLMTALGACTRESAPLQSRFQAAVTPPDVIAGWIIEGRNDFMLFDLRSESAFGAGHLPDAVRVDPAQLQDRGVVRALPDYKKLVFYGADETVAPEVLAPLFERGLHVMVLKGGYDGWQRQVLTEPEEVAGPEDAKHAAVARYFKGESALGTSEPLKEISAEQYLRPPKLPAAAPAPTFESEGC